MSKSKSYVIHYRYLQRLLYKKGFAKQGSDTHRPYTEFARLCRISDGYLSMILSGDRQPSRTVLKRIALHLGISPDNLLASDEDLSEYGLSYAIAGWVVDQEDPETAEKLDAKTVLEFLRYRSKTLEESSEEDEAQEGDASVFAPPDVSDTPESEDS